MIYLLWDWNGTLFNDVTLCVDVMNRMLQKRKLPLLADVAAYHNAFCFPIWQYYTNVGLQFDDDEFERLCMEYMDDYSARSVNCTLYDDAEVVLHRLAESGMKQVILSASKKENLAQQVALFPIGHYFYDMLGLDDIYAKSKIAIGKAWIETQQLDPTEILMVGDTVHDYEVSQALGCHCLLIANGHNSRTALERTGAAVADTILQVPNMLSARGC